MASMSEYGPSQLAQEYTEKQKKLIEECSSVISKEGIELHVDEPIDFGSTPISVDVEHDESGNLVGIGVCHRLFCGYYTRITDYLRSTLERSDLIAHNGVSDFELLRIWGINVNNSQLIWDTMLMGHLIDSSLKDYGLKGMAKRELGIEYPSYDAIVGRRGIKAERITLDKQPLELVSKYNALDCFTTYKLYERQKKAMGI